MPDDRLFHKRLGHSEKVNSLTDFEELVWRAYVLSADDFGVMRFSAITLQADNDRLAQKPQRAVQRALERVRDVGLMTTFEHQGHTYCAQQDWQDYQHVKHPRQTINPKPSDEILATFSASTTGLFRYWPGKKKEIVTEDSGNPSETFGHLARAGARETANGVRPTANGSRQAADRASDQKPSRGSAFDGRRLKVSKRQHALITDELGGMAGYVDLLACYQAWDQELTESGEEFDTLAFVKGKAMELAKAKRRGGAMFAESDSQAVAWLEECRQEHGGACGASLSRHLERMAKAKATA